MAALLKPRTLAPFLRFFNTATACPKYVDPWALATGEERWQAIQYAKGNLDPYMLLPRKRGPGTKDCPNIVLSVYDKRIVGCHCTPDDNKLIFWFLHEGYPRRCKCNHWFVLERIPMPRNYDDDVKPC
ncbi:hypothetical protein RUM43_010146 [Polyplax serrata]|uniref:Uncharacterized protein n=1 Tax=Polyplax serrata TaxID=468196 RepID=A0AAN8P8P2_POLSC